jgi:hypothetical protein
MRSRFVRLGLFILIMLIAMQSYAGRKDYVITLRVTNVVQQGVCPPFGSPPSTFGCKNAIGDIHVGRFSIDDALLQQEGDNLPGTIINFFLEISPTTWDQAYPLPITAFLGFRGPVPSTPLVLFAPSPGFDVHNGTITGMKGTITGLQGGVFGRADIPFVDFLGRNFSAAGESGILTGTLEITPVPSSVTYLVCVLFDQTKAVKSGATIAIKLQLCDANGVNLSSPGIAVIATSLIQVSSNAPAAIEDPGNSNPDNNFRFDPTLGGPGGYVFNLKTTGLAAGTWRLMFVAGTDPVTHFVDFQVR